LTFPIGVLPDEVRAFIAGLQAHILIHSCQLQAVLTQTQELYIRWVAPRAYTSTTPLNSRLSPGLHTFVTPRRRTPPYVLGMHLIRPGIDKL
jgi:hypothetical protein